MTTTSNGKMWLDLTPLGGQPLYCPITLTPESAGGTSFTANVANLSAELLNQIPQIAVQLTGQDTTGELDDGSQFDARIGAIGSFQVTGAASMTVGGSLSTLSSKPRPAAAKSPQQCVFKLTNVQLRNADEFSPLPAPASAPPGAPAGVTRDSIEFGALGKRWRLTDDKSMTWKQLTKSQLAQPIVSGTLATQWHSGDKFEDVSNVAQDICDLLSIALSRSVSWTSFTLKDADQAPLYEYSTAAYAAPFNKHGLIPINNYETGALKSFLERAVPVVAANRPWFHRTLGLVLQAQISDLLDVKCSLLYIAAERLSKYVVGSSTQAEIDPELKKRASKSEFVSDLHAVLNTLSPANWTMFRTNAVIEQIKQWNSGPSFTTKIQRACLKLRLPEPDKALLKPRNPLLHEGELTAANDDIVAHWIELDWVVLAMTLRLFQYEGVYYHRKFGHEPVSLRNQLAAAPSATTPTA
jgi:hypothetical protein